jgi:hypothetical protein
MKMSMCASWSMVRLIMHSTPQQWEEEVLEAADEFVVEHFPTDSRAFMAKPGETLTPQRLQKVRRLIACDNLWSVLAPYHGAADAANATSLCLVAPRTRTTSCCSRPCCARWLLAATRTS